MAELNLGTLQVDIVADGTAAINELEDVTDAAESAGERIAEMAGSAESAEENMDALGDSAGGAGNQLEDMAGAAGGAAERTDGLGQAANRTGDRLSKLQKQLETVGKGLTKYVTTPIVAMYTAATKGAADLVETVGKTEVVFGQFYDRVDKWSQSSIETMGVARSTALDMASLYGDMATGMGFGQEAAADMAMELSSLAADMASFKNISIDVAQTALKSVFTGETESLKNLGVVMTQANLQAYAMSQGITKNIADMTQAEQVTLRYNYVLAQTTNAQGDFARTGDSLSNQSRKLGQTVKQLGETFGTLLIPKVTEIVSWLQGAAQRLMELDDGTKNTILTIGAVVAAAGPMLLALSKTLKLITALKAAMAASTFGPAALAIMGAVGAAGLLVAAFNRTKKEIDTTSESYQKMKKLLDDNLQTTVEVDSSQLDGIEDKTVTVTLTAKGEAVLQTARETIARLKSKEFQGALVIDGDTDAAQKALDNLETAVNAMLAGDGSVAELQAAIDACEELTVSPAMDAGKKRELVAALAELKGQLKDMGNVDVNFRYVDGGGSQKFQTFIDEVNELGWEAKTFEVTGKFDVSEATIDEINEYATALTNAATATGEYKDAVEAANNLLDQQTAAKMQEITNQATEQIREQAILFNSGIIDETTYNAAVQTIVDGATKEKEALEATAAAAKETNDILANGKRGDDAAYLAQISAQLYSGETISTEDWKGATAAIKETVEAEGDLTAQQTDAKVALEGLKNTAVDSFGQMIAAQEEYNAAMNDAADVEAQADQMEKRAAAAEKLAEQFDALRETLVVLGDTEAAIEAVAYAMAESEEEAAALKDQMLEMFTGGDGQLMDWETAFNSISEYIAAMENEGKLSQDKADELRTQAQTAREEAVQSFGDSMAQIQQAFGLTSEGLQELLGAIAASGVEIDPAAVELISGVQSMISEVATTLSDGKTETADGVSEMIGAVGDAKSDAEAQGRPVGAAITAGITSGLNSGTGTLYSTVRRIVANAIKTAKAEAKIASPSKRMRDEVGRMLIRGMDVGAKLEMPSVLSGMRENMNKIISGAQAVVNRGNYTVPAVDSVGRWSGIDYQKMGDALAGAVQDTPVALVVNDKAIARTTSEATGRAQAIRAQRINAGKGRW